MPDPRIVDPVCLEFAHELVPGLLRGGLAGGDVSEDHFDPAVGDPHGSHRGDDGEVCHDASTHEHTFKEPFLYCHFFTPFLYRFRHSLLIWLSIRRVTCLAHLRTSVRSMFGNRFPITSAVFFVRLVFFLSD